MSQGGEVPIVLGCPDYDVPLGRPLTRADGLAVTGRDSLGYLWRFVDQRASLWARRGEAVGAYRGEIALARPVPEDVAGQCELLREAQAVRREVQTAYVNLAETLLSMAGDAPHSALVLRLRAVRAHCAEELLIFTDPPDDAAHAAFRVLPELANIRDASPEDRVRLRPLAVSLLEATAELLGIADPEGLLALVGEADGGRVTLR